MKIGIVGLGLIGGSIFKALENLSYEVIGISNSQNAKQKNITDDLKNLKDCNVVFVATPINKTIEVLHKLEKILPKTTIVADVCSLKEFICKETFHFNFIPTHPMAGTENSGYENSFKELFIDAKWVICKQKYPIILKELIEKMGAKIIYASPKEHDEAVAMISHMPMLISQAIFKTTENDVLAQKLASSGFRDTTRLALSNTEMADDMIQLNYKNIQASILKLYSSIGNLVKHNYKKQIDEIKNNRSKMYKNGKNIL